MKRRLCVVVNSRANYARIKSLLFAASDSRNLDLRIILGASAVIDKYGNLAESIAQEGLEVDSVVHTIVEGGTPETMAKSTGLGIIELSTQLSLMKPDVVLTVADRFETLATAVAASYMNIPLAHTQGGEVTGSIDESVRHAISKLAHIHFPATKRAHQNLLSMGEDEDRIHLTGCPSIDLARNVREASQALDPEELGGTGTPIDLDSDYVIAMQHPVTTEFGQASRQITETLQALVALRKSKPVQILWFWPNIDAGTDEISKVLRLFREGSDSDGFHFFKNLEPEKFLTLLLNSKCIVGNSSVGIREASYLGVPSVNIGSRQFGRERGPNVVDVPHDRVEILRALNHQYSVGRYQSSELYGDGSAGPRIAKILGQAEFRLQKTLSYAT